MNNKDFINALALQLDMPTKEAQKLTDAMTEAMAERLDTETSLTIQGFGVFEVKKKIERIVVNPATKQRKLVPPKLVLAFKPAKMLKEKLN